MTAVLSEKEESQRLEMCQPYLFGNPSLNLSTDNSFVSKTCFRRRAQKLYLSEISFHAIVIQKHEI